MKKFYFLAALFCLLAMASPMNAQLVIRNSGHAEVGVNPSTNDMIAGRSVESTRAIGDVVVQSGVEYEIEASGTVTLQDGFKVEKGATFAIYPSSF